MVKIFILSTTWTVICIATPAHFVFIVHFSALNLQHISISDSKVSPIKSLQLALRFLENPF
jgi:hypothetical protein